MANPDKGWTGFFHSELVALKSMYAVPEGIFVLLLTTMHRPSALEDPAEAEARRTDQIIVAVSLVVIRALGNAVINQLNKM